MYGCGNRFLDGIRSLNDIFAALGGQRRVFYFGDLDPQGLFIPKVASARAQALGLPAVEPHLWSYRQLVKLGIERGHPMTVKPHHRHFAIGSVIVPNPSANCSPLASASPRNMSAGNF